MEWATGNGIRVDRVAAEVGSARNGRRKKSLALLGDRLVSTIVVEYLDRFVRFAVEYVEASLSDHNRTLVVVDAGEIDRDLVRDMTEILNLVGRRAVREARRGPTGPAA
jgi:predicted site-specific integrase-resolvase